MKQDRLESHRCELLLCTACIFIIQQTSWGGTFSPPVRKQRKAKGEYFIFTLWENRFILAKQQCQPKSGNTLCSICIEDRIKLTLKSSDLIILYIITGQNSLNRSQWQTTFPWLTENKIRLSRQIDQRDKATDDVVIRQIRKCKKRNNVTNVHKKEHFVFAVWYEHQRHLSGKEYKLTWFIKLWLRFNSGC